MPTYIRFWKKRLAGDLVESLGKLKGTNIHYGGHLVVKRVSTVVEKKCGREEGENKKEKTKRMTRGYATARRQILVKNQGVRGGRCKAARVRVVFSERGVRCNGLDTRRLLRCSSLLC